jgi:hypothetical protein
MGASDMTEPRFVLNVNPGGDVLHTDPREECNLDDAKDRQYVDARTAASLIASGQAVACAHCGLPADTHTEE